MSTGALVRGDVGPPGRQRVGVGDVQVGGGGGAQRVVVGDHDEVQLDPGERGEAVALVVGADHAPQGGVVLECPGEVGHREDGGDADLRCRGPWRADWHRDGADRRPVWPWRGRRWSHLVSDVSYDELHAFVGAELGIPRRAFQGDHYDVPEELTSVAVAAGAQPVGCRELLSRLLAAGLRVRKPRGAAAG